MVLLSLDYNYIAKLIKRAAIEVTNAQKPMAMCLGNVVSTNPLKISVDQKMTLTAAQLMLTNAVRDYTVEMTVDHKTESESGGSGDAAFATHTHDYKGRKKFKVHLGLKTGEKVILLRCDGGQMFIVLDRVEVPNG